MPQDFSHQNLRGRSFKGQDLAEANFSYADIQSCNFTDANLRNANFSHAKAGLQKRWLTIQLIIFLGLDTLAGIMSGFTGVFSGFMLHPEIIQTSTIFPGIIVLLGLIILSITVISQGFTFRAFGTIAVSIIIAVFLGVTFGSLNFNGAFGSIFAFAFAIAVAVASTFTSAIASYVLGMTTANSIIAIVLTFFFAVVIAVPFTIVLAHSITIPIAVVVISSTTVLLLGSYIAWRSLQGDKKFILIRMIGLGILAYGGTTFRNADLTDAVFTCATVKSTDFRNANIIRTDWRNAQKLDCIRSGKTYLENEQVRHLVVTGEGKNKNFDRLDLRGLNLSKANLENASFIDSDLYQANLSIANLSRAILVRTNFERVDLRGACLTGSCIQDWTISKGTKLDGIICDYVYLKWIDGDKRDQMPPRGKFKDGGFITFVKYILDTVELYHEKDINPRLALNVLQKMSRDYDEPFDIVAIGKREEKVFIQVKVSENVIRENFQEDYYSRYDTDLKLWSGNIHQLSPTVNSFIEKRINEIISEITDDFVFVDAKYVEGNYTEIYQGEANMSGERNINMGSGNYNESIQGDYVQGSKKQSNFDLTNAQFGGGLVNADTVNAEQIGGNITNYNPDQKQNLAQAAAEIQQLLQQLEKTNSTTTSADKLAVAAKAVDEIEKNPTLKLWVIEALLFGHREALKEAIGHPSVNILMASIEDWQNERNSLEKAYTLQSQKIASIRNAWVIETDPSRKFQYEQQLQSEERILKKLNDKLNEIE